MLAGICFDLKEEQNEQSLNVEMYFNEGREYNNVWSVASDGKRIPVTASTIHNKDYEMRSVQTDNSTLSSLFKRRL